MTLVRLGMSLVGISQAFNQAVHAILSFTPFQSSLTPESVLAAAGMTSLLLAR